MPTPRLITRCLVAVACLAGIASAQQPSPNLTGLAHVAIRVHDLNASVAFYEKLGFVKAFTLSRDGAVYEAFIKINDRQFLELYPADAKNTQIGFLHVCFDGNDLQSVHDFYIAQGLHPGEVAIHGAGNRLFTMPGPLSPTGPQNMEYTQYMPGSLHSKDLGQHLGADRISTHMTAVTLAVDDPAAARAFYIDKLHFAANKSAVSIPGSNGESLEIVPAQPLGFKARIHFQADASKAKATLKKAGIPFTGKSVAEVTDPDGNQITFN